MKSFISASYPFPLPHLAGTLCAMLLLSACSMGQLVVRGTASILDSGLESMNRESDLQLAREAMPANLKLLEGMLIEDPGNSTLRLYAAEGFYGYSFGFIGADMQLRPGQNYLAKPYLTRDLIEAVSRCLDGAPVSLAS